MYVLEINTQAKGVVYINYQVVKVVRDEQNNCSLVTFFFGQQAKIVSSESIEKVESAEDLIKTLVPTD